MTLCIAWQRHSGADSEICLAADSSFTGGQKFLAAPKVFSLSRGDCAFACAGSTTYSFPIAIHIVNAISLNQKLMSRALDVTDILHYIEDIANKCLHQEHDRQDMRIEPIFNMIFTGFSWRHRKPVMAILEYNPKEQKMTSRHATTTNGCQIAFIGDATREARINLNKLLNKRSYRDNRLDYLPLDILMSYIKNPNYPSIGGHPQMVKIYPFLNTLPIAFKEKGVKDETIITYYGRPLLNYETCPFPIYDVETGKTEYMKTQSTEFELKHEDIRPLSKFS